jgi:hypothetical protein
MIVFVRLRMIARENLFVQTAIGTAVLTDQDFKDELVLLVGWEAQSRDPRIRTMEAYDAAYDKLYTVLPHCRNCICI